MSEIRSFWNNVVNTAEDTWDTVEDKASEAYDDASDKVNETYEDAKKGASEMYDDASKEISETYEDAKKGASQMYDDASKKANETYEDAKKGASELYDDASKAISETYDDAKDKVNEVYDDAKQAVDDAEEAIVGKFSRGMTGPEKTQAQSVYQDSIDYDKVVITCGGLGAAGAPARALGNTLAFAPSYFEPNTTNLTAAGMITLVHELGHVWQYQTAGPGYIPNALIAQGIAAVTTGDRGNAYVWEDAHNANKPWEQWNAEQQAEAMEDYYKATLRIQEARNKVPPEPPSVDDEETVRILEPYVGKVRAGQGAPQMPDVRTGPTPFLGSSGPGGRG